MKIIHCADLHLDSKLTANLSREKAKIRKNEILHTFVRMTEYAVLNRVQAIIIAGDLFDTANVSATARNIVYDTVSENSGIMFYYLKGNHDTDNFLSSIEKVPDNLKLFSEEWTSYMCTSGETVGNDGIMGNSENKKNGNTEYDGNAYNESDDVIEKNMRSIVITGLELNEQNSISAADSLVLDQNDINIVVLHGQEASYGARDNAQIINISGFKNKGIDYMALGHIHTFKEEKLDKRGVYCYSGCLDGRGFDECGQCGFVLLDIDEESRSVRRQFVPFASRIIYTVNVDVSGCMTSGEILGKVREYIEKQGYDGSSLLKIVLKGSVDALCEKNTDYIRQSLEDRFFCVKVYDETVLKVDYKSYALDESLKGEFVRTVMNEEGLDVEMKAQVIRYGIQMLGGMEE